MRDAFPFCVAHKVSPQLDLKPREGNGELAIRINRNPDEPFARVLYIDFGDIFWNAVSENRGRGQGRLQFIELRHAHE